LLRPPALTILDVRMPRLDGLAVARRLRADPRTAGMPMILLTASVSEADVARGLDAGVDDFVGKPFSPQELGTRVQAILDGK
jgi:DNA-binding response OmpR family regulator